MGYTESSIYQSPGSKLQSSLSSSNPPSKDRTPVGGVSRVSPETLKTAVNKLILKDKKSNFSNSPQVGRRSEYHKRSSKKNLQNLVQKNQQIANFPNKER